MFATTTKNLDVAEDASTSGAAPGAWFSLDRLLGMPRQGRDGGNRSVAPGGTCHLPDGAHGFTTLSLRREHPLLNGPRNPCLPAPLVCSGQGC